MVAAAFSPSDAAWVRINTVRTDLCRRRPRRRAPGSPPAIRIPKAESADDVQWVADRAPGTPLICAIESARGLLAAPEIARVPGVRAPVHGRRGPATRPRRRRRQPADAVRALAHRRGLARRRARAARSTASTRASTTTRGCASRPSSPARSASSASPRSTRGSSPILHDVFTPSARELTWAQAVLDAFAAAGGNAVRLPDGEFVDLPVADRARRLLELAGRRPAGVGASGVT